MLRKDASSKSMCSFVKTENNEKKICGNNLFNIQSIMVIHRLNID